MKKTYSILSAIVIVLTLATAPLIFPGDVRAEKKDFVFAVALSLYPESGEAMGLNLYLSSLMGLTQIPSDLKGQLNVKIYDKAQLYATQEECIAAVGSGAIQGTFAASTFFEQYQPQWKLVNSPGIFDSWEHFLRVMETPPWKALQPKLAKENGITVIQWIIDCGTWYLYTNKGPAKTLEDIKGQKIRYSTGEGFARALKALGVTGIGLPYTEVVTALQTHMIDGILTDFPSARTYYNLDRYCQFANLIPLAIQPVCFIVNTKWFESLDPKVRAAFMIPFDRIPNTNKWYKDFEQKQIQVWRDDPKTTVVEYNKEEHARWRNAIKPVIADMVKEIDPIYMKAVDEVR